MIATHKKYEMPTDDLYLPIHVGAELNKDKDLGYQKIMLEIIFLIKMIDIVN